MQSSAQRRGAPPPPVAPPPANISRCGRVPPPKGAPPPNGIRRARPGGSSVPRPRLLDPQAHEEGLSKKRAVGGPWRVTGTSDESGSGSERRGSDGPRRHGSLGDSAEQGDLSLSSPGHISSSTESDNSKSRWKRHERWKEYSSSGHTSARNTDAEVDKGTRSGREYRTSERNYLSSEEGENYFGSTDYSNTSRRGQSRREARRVKDHGDSFPHRKEATTKHRAGGRRENRDRRYGESDADSVQDSGNELERRHYGRDRNVARKKDRSRSRGRRRKGSTGRYASSDSGLDERGESCGSRGGNNDSGHGPHSAQRRKHRGAGRSKNSDERNRSVQTRRDRHRDKSFGSHSEVEPSKIQQREGKQKISEQLGRQESTEEDADNPVGTDAADIGADSATERKLRPAASSNTAGTLGRPNTRLHSPKSASPSNGATERKTTKGDRRGGSSGSVPQTAGSSASSGVPAGKPIRGARAGEAIGVRSRIFDTTTIPTSSTGIKSFVCSPLSCGPGSVVRCFIERNRSGTHTLSHVFSMYADLEDGSGRLLLAARKLLASKTAYYIVCMRQDDLFRDSGKRGGASFLGKLRASSAAHAEYCLYDGGDNPATTADKTGDSDYEAEAKSPRNLADGGTAKGSSKESNALRKELGVITYNFDKKDQRTGKRRMEVAIPQLHQKGDAWEPVIWQPSDTKESMPLNFGRVRYQGAQNQLQDDRLLVMHQRESRYDPLSSCLVDFRGRATAPSVKNFQLIKSCPEDNIKRARYFSEDTGNIESDDVPRPVWLQMGKVGKDCFNVDVEWPLSLLQAFAICLSRFDTNAHF